MHTHRKLFVREVLNTAKEFAPLFDDLDEELMYTDKIHVKDVFQHFIDQYAIKVEDLFTEGPFKSHREASDTSNTFHKKNKNTTKSSLKNTKSVYVHRHLTDSEKDILAPLYKDKTFTRAEAAKIKKRYNMSLPAERIRSWSAYRRHELKTAQKPTYRRNYYLGEDVIKTLHRAYIDNNYNYPNMKERERMSKELNITVRQIENCFYNQRKANKLPKHR